MKKVFLRIIALLAIASFSISACKYNNSEEVVAKIGDENIYLTDVDINIQNSLYEFLFGIFKVRAIALESLIIERVLIKESEIQGISVDSLVKMSVRKRMKNFKIDEFIKLNSLENGVIDPKQPFRNISIDSEEGKIILNKSYEDFLKSEYVNDLKKKFQVTTTLKPPIGPKLDLRGVSFMGRGYELSKHAVWIISDFTCPSCRQYEHTINAFYERFKDKVFFKYAHFSGGVNTSMILADCAGEQDKYWDAYTALHKQNVDSPTEVKALMAYLKLDAAKCMACIAGYDSTKVLASMKRLADQKVTGTPTIIIDGRIYYGEISLEELSKQLNAALDQ
ncbi:thioredoxin domain-containing protein [Dyadobacter sp. 676]|uniref:Thioredoxin domain-containing protein n=1 Tax=Dyadobacter sp. 676 TaxID=3088362 RepID=A0AAU8FNX4_9BACT